LSDPFYSCINSGDTGMGKPFGGALKANIPIMTKNFFFGERIRGEPFPVPPLSCRFPAEFTLGETLLFP